MTEFFNGPGFGAICAIAAIAIMVYFFREVSKR